MNSIQSTQNNSFTNGLIELTESSRRAMLKLGYNFVALRSQVKRRLYYFILNA